MNKSRRLSNSTTRPVLLAALAVLLFQPSCSFVSRLSGNDIVSHREKWRASGIKDYKMFAVIQKTGHMTPMGTYLITIRDGKTESVFNGASPYGNAEPPLPTSRLDREDFLSRLGPFDSIDDYFDYIERESKKDPEIFETKFHPTLGYPTYINLDPRKRINDDELLVRVLSLDPL
jgi:hypothetical protein